LNLDGITDTLGLMKQLVQTIGEDSVDTEVRNLNSKVEHELQLEQVPRQEANKEIFNDNGSEHESDEETDLKADEASRDDTFVP